MLELRGCLGPGFEARELRAAVDQLPDGVGSEPLGGRDGVSALQNVSVVDETEVAHALGSLYLFVTDVDVVALVVAHYSFVDFNNFRRGFSDRDYEKVRKKRHLKNKCKTDRTASTG